MDARKSASEGACYGQSVAEIDVVVVSYNSAATLRDAVSALAEAENVNVIVVDNDSQDGSVDSVAGLRLTVLPTTVNRGFASGCNRGLEAGSAPYVLFLNPDARIDVDALGRLVSVLASDAGTGLVAPRVVAEDGSLEYSQRRYPRVRSTFAQAFLLPRLLPRAAWADECIRDPRAYAESGDCEWVSGACMLVRRSAIEAIGGWDEGFFLYGEDIDLCRRMWEGGYSVRYEASATATHIGGASSPRGRSIPFLARGRIRFARKHLRPGVALLHQTGIALGAFTHAVFTTQGRGARAGQIRALKAAIFYDATPTRTP